MARTFVQQSQISGSLAFNDEMAAGSGLAYKQTIVEDLDALRSQVNKIIGGERWYDALSGSQDLADIYAAMQVSGATAAFQGDITLVGSITGSNSEFSGYLTVGGNAGIGGDLDVAGSLSAQKVSVDGDVAQRLYIVDADGSLKDESSLTFDGSQLSVTGAASISNGLTVNGAVADFNADVTANKISIDGDTAQRLYIVDTDGSIKDEQKLTFDGSELAVDGALDVGAGNFTASAAGVVYVASTLEVDGAATLDAGLQVNGAVADFNADVTANKISIDGDVAQRLYIVDSDGSIKDESSLTFDGSQLSVTGAASISNGLTVNGAVADFNADVTANKISIDGDVAQRLYIVDADGSIKDESKLTFDGSELAVDGALEATGNAVIGGLLDVTGVADFAGDVFMAQALGVSGSLSVAGPATMSDGLTVSGDRLEVTGSMGVTGAVDFDSTLNVDGAATLGSTLDVAGAVVLDSTLEVSGAATLNGTLHLVGAATLDAGLSVAAAATFSDTLSVSELATLSNGLVVNGAAADFNADVTANKISIDGDVATRLYIVDADGSIKDESKLTFDGSELYVQGDARFTGHVQVDGDLRVKGTMTYIDTANMRVEDAFIYLATGSAGTTDSGIVLHGGAGANMDLVIGQDGGAGEVIFGKGNRAPDGDGAMAGIALVPAWMSSLKVGALEGSLSGSFEAVAGGAQLSAEADLLLKANGEDAISFIESGDKSAFDLQFPGMSLVAAIVAAGGNFKQDSFKPGVKSAGDPIDYSSVGALRTASYASLAAKKLAMDVFLNGVRLAYGDDYAIDGSGGLSLSMGTMADDSLTVVIHNAL